jgi:hypothetical protein
VNAAAHDLDVSVIVTLMDDRGQFRECLTGWTQGQTHPRDRYEVIVVGTGREPAPEAIARSLVTPNDHVLIFESRNEIALFDLGARRARGKWLLFTEAHCAPEPRCLAELIAYLEAHDGRYHGACIRSAPDGSSHPLAMAEARWYQHGFSTWSGEGDWRKVTIRGTAVHRDAYADVGGFKSAFGCFAETLLAAELHADGYRLGYAPAAAVKHYNSTDLRDLLAYVNEYRAGEAAFQTSADSARLAHYFDWPDAADAGVFDLRLAFNCAARSLRRALARPQRRATAALARAMLTTLAGLTAKAADSGRVRLLKAALAYAWARGQFALPPHDAERRYMRFCRLWDKMSDLAAARAHLRNGEPAREPAVAKIAECLLYRPGDMAPSRLRGFHGRELYQGDAFRWTAPLAQVRVSVPAADYEMQIDTRGVAGDPPPLLDAYLNGHVLPPVRSGDFGLAIFHAPRETFHSDSSQILVLTSGRFRRVGATEHRSLGVPIFSVRFVPRSPTSDPSLPVRIMPGSFSGHHGPYPDPRG